MAIYHFSTHTHSRSKGHSAVAAAAYRSGEVLIDERTGKRHDYRHYRKTHGAVLASDIFLPPGTPAQYRDRGTLWNGGEAAEKTKAGAYKKTAVIAREMEAALPHELNEEQQKVLCWDFSQWVVNRFRVGLDVSLHAPDKNGDNRNWHAHFLLTTRILDANGFGEKGELELSGQKKKELGLPTGKEQIKEMRRAWAYHVNKALERAGCKERVDHRSFKDLGLADRRPTKHLGVAVTQMERRGIKTRRGDENRAIQAHNRKQARKETRRRKRILQRCKACLRRGVADVRADRYGRLSNKRDRIRRRRRAEKGKPSPQEMKGAYAQAAGKKHLRTEWGQQQAQRGEYRRKEERAVSQHHKTIKTLLRASEAFSGCNRREERPRATMPVRGLTRSFQPQPS